MQQLWDLLDTMRPVIEITGRASDHYRCDKCSNASNAKKPPQGDVHHHVLDFSVLDDDYWAVSRPETVFLYLVTIEGSGATFPRYVGVSKASYLRGRWTRLPTGESHRFRHGDLLHHQAAQMHRIEIEMDDPQFVERRLRLRLYATLVPRLVPAVTKGVRYAPRVAKKASPLGIDAEYEYARGVEEDTADLMTTLKLRPWNRTKGKEHVSMSAALGPTAWTDRRYIRPQS